MVGVPRCFDLRRKGSRVGGGMHRLRSVAAWLIMCALISSTEPNVRAQEGSGLRRLSRETETERHCGGDEVCSRERQPPGRVFTLEEFAPILTDASVWSHTPDVLVQS